jgi:hypothetical protein
MALEAVQLSDAIEVLLKMQAKRSGATQSHSIRRLLFGAYYDVRTSSQTLHHRTNKRKKTLLYVTLKQHPTKFK